MATRKIKVLLATAIMVAATPLFLWIYAGSVDVITASQKGDIDAIRFVLQWRPQHALRGRMTSPLWQASYHGHIEIVQLLIVHGASPNDQAANTGYSALNMARLAGHTEIAQYLIEHGSNRMQPPVSLVR